MSFVIHKREGYINVNGLKCPSPKCKPLSRTNLPTPRAGGWSPARAVEETKDVEGT